VSITAELLDEIRRYYDASVPGPGPGPAPGMFTYAGSVTGRAGRAAAGPGQVTMAGPQDNPGSLWISTVDTAGNDVSARIALVVAGTVIRLDQVGDATKWAEYVAVGPAVADGASARFDGIVHWAQGALLDDGAPVTITGRPMTAEEMKRSPPMPQPASGGGRTTTKRKATP